MTDLPRVFGAAEENLTLHISAFYFPVYYNPAVFFCQRKIFLSNLFLPKFLRERTLCVILLFIAIH